MGREVCLTMPDLMLEGEIKIDRFHITKSKNQLFKKFNLLEFDVRRKAINS